MTHGFGFSFPNGDDRDDRDNRDNQGDGEHRNPFSAFGSGSSGLGDMLNQFGQMLSGMGSSMNAQQQGDAVNFDLAARMARQRIAGINPVSEADSRAVEESVSYTHLTLPTIYSV